MRTTARRALGWLLAIAGAGGACAPSARSAGAGAATITVTSQTAGEDSFAGATPFIRLELGNLPASRVVVRLESGRMVHHFLIDPTDPWIGTGAPVRLIDYFLLFAEGPRKVAVQVREHAKLKMLAETTLSLDVKRPDPATMQEYLEHPVYWEIAAAGTSLREADDDYRRVYFDSRMGSADATSRLQSAADNYLERRTLDLIWRISAYALLAEHYERGFHPEQAKLALACADEIYEKERETKFTGPNFAAWPIIYTKAKPTEAPLHFNRYARYYARRGDRDKAIDWLKQEAEWYVTQSKAPHLTAARKLEARMFAARAYRHMAHLEMVLRNKIDFYEGWMAKFREMLPPAYASPAAPNDGPVIRVTRTF